MNDNGDRMIDEGSPVFEERSRTEVEVHQLKEHFNLQHGIHLAPPKGTKNRNSLIAQLHARLHESGLAGHPEDAR